MKFPHCVRGFGLKTLLAMVSIAAVVTYCYCWRVRRPPYQPFDADRHKAVFESFIADLRSGRLNEAYAATTSRFQHETTYRQFVALVRRYPALRRGTIDPERGYRAPRAGGGGGIQLKRHSTHGALFHAEKKPVELWAWVLTDDSFFHLRPPRPKIDEVQFRLADPSKPPFEPPLRAS